MKFLPIKKFIGRSLDDLIRYAAIDLAKGLADITIGLTRLTFRENFPGFTEQVTLAASASVGITNQLKSRQIYWWAVRCVGDNELVETEVTEELITIKNVGGASCTALLLFVRA